MHRSVIIATGLEKAPAATCPLINPDQVSVSTSLSYLLGVTDFLFLFRFFTCHFLFNFHVSSLGLKSQVLRNVPKEYIIKDYVIFFIQIVKPCLTILYVSLIPWNNQLNVVRLTTKHFSQTFRLKLLISPSGQNNLSRCA